MMTNEPAHLATLIEAHWVRGEGHLAAGRLDAAEAEVREALRRLGYPEKTRGPRLPNVLLSLARVQRAQGDVAEAAESARAALRMFEWDAIDPAQSADVGEALLELAQDQAALGDQAEAAKSLAAAVRSLRNGLGSDHPITKQAERLSQI
jgi:tetratricopeptide (TPR) repeat protein